MRKNFTVVVTGAESTGKSTLAAQLSDAFGAPLLEEQLRVWVERKGAPPASTEEMAEVANLHMHLADALDAEPHEIVILDTDLLSVLVYWDHYFGVPPRWLFHAVAIRRPDLYIVAKDNIPWSPDSQRDGPGIRSHLQPAFESLAPTLAPCVTADAVSAKRRLSAAARVICAKLAR